MKLERSYMGWEISLAWPFAALRPDACKPDYEKWEAYGPNHNAPNCHERVGGNSLAEIKRTIREQLK